MSRLKAFFFLVLLWSAIYLPGLGSTEIKGEEGRRILPAITMLESGNWLVPYVGGKPFLRKPPMVNWAIAGAFKLTGVRNEWTARLPSALCVAALGLTIVATSGRGWLEPGPAFAAAILAMTQIGLLAKARFAGAEIEGIYVPLSAIAIVVWLAWWARGLSPWLFWTVSGFFLGLASLAKGPSLHLLVYYVVVITVLWQSTRNAASRLATFARHFFHPAHLAGIAISAAMFAAWAVPYFKTPEAQEKDAAQVWKRQGIDRFTEAEITVGGYAMNLPRGLMDQLPWLLLLPCLWRKRAPVSSDESHAVEPGRPIPWRPLVTVAGIAFFVVLFVPGALPRYVLPLGVVFALALAQAVEAQGPALRRWHLANRIVAVAIAIAALAAPLCAGYPLGETLSFDLPSALRAGLAATAALAICAFVFARRSHTVTLAWVAGASGALLGAAMFIYAAAAVRWINRSDNVRPVARAIDAAVPPGEVLTIYDPGYLAAIFYLHTPYRYATVLEEIPGDASWILARGKERKKFLEKNPGFSLARVIPGREGEEFLLLQRSGELQKLRAR
jgi:4-amino-4-deoxy-L-arabinose transferase-like glycosyltransferase